MDEGGSGNPCKAKETLAKKHKDNEINGKEKKFKRKKRSNRARETATTINDREGAKNSRIEI